MGMRCRGVFHVEWAVLVAAVIAAAVFMSKYVNDSIRGTVRMVEIKANTAIQDNRPLVLGQ